MVIMIHAKFHFNWLMLTLTFGIWASEPQAWRTTETAGPDGVKQVCSRYIIIKLREINITFPLKTNFPTKIN